MTLTLRNALHYPYREEGMLMMTVNEVSKLTGVSVRALQYYDSIGLLKPSGYTEAGYRLYDETQLERLQQILLFRELEFPLKEIKKILDSDGFDRKKALEQQIELLTLKKEHLENLITFAREIKRNPQYLKGLTRKMVDEGLLQRAFPVPNHPAQRYKRISKGDGE